MAHPPRYRDDDPLLARVRDIALALPGASEKVSHGRPNFFTKRVFAIFGGVVKGDHASDALGQAVLVLPDEAERPALLADGRFVVPGYEGAYGWLALDLRGEPDWTEVAELVESSYRLTAPARLVAELDARGG
ncbi:MmcQ/YjbR family DNA-binding protein [Oryzobacter sp. R7]|uniref:MmcQ/YjbR family DNA-binding protein n=1 Tax=Oryzobacter faecalis TaxID=3388656 RepID=UPI00398CEE1A